MDNDKQQIIIDNALRLMDETIKQIVADIGLKDSIKHLESNIRLFSLSIAIHKTINVTKRTLDEYIRDNKVTDKQEIQKIIASDMLMTQCVVASMIEKYINNDFIIE
jgi:hypothetical protein